MHIFPCISAVNKRMKYEQKNSKTMISGSNTSKILLNIKNKQSLFPDVCLSDRNARKCSLKFE